MENYEMINGVAYPKAMVPKPMPTLSGTQPPQPAQQGSSLLSFSSTLAEVTNLAKQKRNASSLAMMQPFQGTVAASDFNSILSNLNNASDTRATDLTKQVLKEPDISTFTQDNGTVTGVDRSTGEVVWTTPGVGNRQNSTSTSSPSSGGMSSKQITALKNALNASKFEGDEADGQYADPNLYLQNYNSWRAAGGSVEEFFRNFPPSTFINPANTWLPDEIMKFTKADDYDL